MVQQREKLLEQAVEAAKGSGGCDDIVVTLENRLQEQQKQASSPVSIHKKIEITKNFIERAVRRESALQEQMQELLMRQEEQARELAEARQRLHTMEEEAMVRHMMEVL